VDFQHIWLLSISGCRWDVCAQCSVDVELNELATKLNEIPLAVLGANLSIFTGVAQIFKGHTKVAVNVGRYGS
jgi:hypothetical protein